MLRGFVEKNQREVWRDAFWRHMRWDRDEPATPWCDDDSAEQRGESVGFLTSPLLYRWPKLMAIAEQLGGADFLPFGRGGSALVTWPGTGGNHWQDLDPAAGAAGVDPMEVEKGIGLGGHLDGAHLPAVPLLAPPVDTNAVEQVTGRPTLTGRGA